jgi:hypothetical protein
VEVVPAEGAIVAASCAFPLFAPAIAWVNPAGFSPRVQVRTTIDYLAAKTIECWPHIFVPPLGQFVAIAD